MRKLIVRVIFLAVVIFLFIGTSARCQEWRKWRNLTVADGLAGSNIHCIIEDRSKNLWIGTDKGLSQFNGLFTTHLSGMWIYSVLESRDGRIWAGTWMNSGLWVYDGENWQKQIIDGVAVVSALLESSDGKIWAGTNYGLCSYDGTKWERIFPWAGGGAFVYKMMESSDGTIWAWTDKGLYSYDRNVWKKHLENMDVYTVIESSDGMIWAGVINVGLYRYDGIQWQQYLSETGVYCLFESSDKKLWVGTAQNGLRVYDGVKWQEHFSRASTTYNHQFILESQDGRVWVGRFDGLYSYDGTEWKQHLSGFLVYSLFESSDGRIWSFTFDNGLFSYDYTMWQTYFYNREATSSYTFFESSDGTIWAGTADGLQSYDGVKWHEQLSKGIIRDILESSDGMIWVRRDDGLYRYNGTTWQEYLSGKDIIGLLESSDGKIYVGTLDGMQCYDGAKWELITRTSLVPVLQSSDGTIWGIRMDLAAVVNDAWHELFSYDGKTLNFYPETRPYISRIFESSDGKIWVGTRPSIYESVSGSLYSYDGVNWQKHWDGMEISNIMESSDGKLWVGTGSYNSSGSLYSYDGISWQEHLSGVGFTDIMETSKGRILAATWGKGIQIFDGTTWSTLQASDGLVGDWVDSIMEDKNGKLWFGTAYGICVYKPNYNPPYIEITEPREQVIETGTTSITVRWIVGDRETDTRLLAIQYKIDNGLWQQAPSNFMTTPPMDDGKHTFYLRALDRDFNYSKTASLTILVNTTGPTVVITSALTI